MPNISQTDNIDKLNSTSPGKLFVVGIGPGAPEHRTVKALEVIAACDTIVGYTAYVESIADLLEGSNKRIITSGMKKEIDRCRAALHEAAAGSTVALISSGDAGVYGMAGLALELKAAENSAVPVEIIPGVTAAGAAAAALGAPLMLDFAVVSLSDLLVPWDNIKRRLEAVASADMVAALYNPRSKKRTAQLEETIAIFRQFRPDTTPVGIVTAAGTPIQTRIITDLAHTCEQVIGMRTVVIITNSTTELLGGQLVTPRGYQL
ncbi:MAG: precorrin-3B C(17)-methyltransferase [Deltaproteobacteria bacterium]|nr:precorrin-3B C(17)-methyltransferase [Deltaproteobacteria bacterium]